MTEYYMLNDKHEAVAVDFDTFIASRQRGGRGFNRVAEDTLPDGRWVSTVFLGMNHSFRDGPPMIFETLVFPRKGKWTEESGERYSTWDEAMAGHTAVVAKLKGEG